MIIAFSASRASATQDSWRVDAQDYDSGANLVYVDPCDATSGDRYYDVSCAYTNQGPIQYHDWNFGASEQLSNRTLDDLLLFAVLPGGNNGSLGNNNCQCLELVGAKQYDAEDTTGFEKYRPVVAAPAWAVGQGAGTFLDDIYGFEGAGSFDFIPVGSTDGFGDSVPRNPFLPNLLRPARRFRSLDYGDVNARGALKRAARVTAAAVSQQVHPLVAAPDLVSHVLTTPRVTAGVMPTSSGACLDVVFDGASYGGCKSASGAMSQGIVLIIGMGSNGYEVVGDLPTGAHSPAMQVDGHTVSPVVNADGAFAYATSKMPTQVRFVRGERAITRVAVAPVVRVTPAIQ